MARAIVASMAWSAARLGGLGLIVAVAPMASAQVPFTTLEPRAVVERLLAPGELHGFSVAGTAGEPWRLRVRQLGVDLTIEIRDPGGESLGVTNGPIDRRGEETVWVEPAASGVYRIELRASAPRAAAGRYVLRLEPMAAVDPAEAEAERWTTAAGRQAAGDRESRRAALASYRRALEQWRGLGRHRRTAAALHAMALLAKSLPGDDPAADEPEGLFRQAADLWAELGETGLEALAVAELGLARLEEGDPALARELLERALALNRGAGQLFEAAGNRMDLGFVAQRRGALGDAEASYTAALELYRQLGDATYEGVLLGNLGGVAWQLGDAETALDRYGEALSRHRAVGDRRQEARILNNQAALYRSLAEAERALVLYDQAGRLYAELDDPRGRARVLNNTGFAYRELGELERARGYFERALEERHRLDDRRGAAASLSNLGSVHDRRGELIEALGYYRRSRDLRRELGDRRGESASASLLGWTLARLGRDAEARASFDHAARLLEGRDDGSQAYRLARQAEALLELGDVEAARAFGEQAVALYRRLDQPLAEAGARFVVARAMRARGELEGALAGLEEAIEIVEDLRADLRNPAFRELFWGSQASLWELRVELLMALHDRDPGAGHQLTALRAAESARARGWLELLTEAGAEPRRGIDPGLLERRRQLLRRLSLLADRRGSPAGQAERVAAREQVLAELDLLESTLRRHHPGFAELSPPRDGRSARPGDLAAARSWLGDGDLLLYYALGDERGFVWALDAESVEVFGLPPRRRVEDAARRAHLDLATARPLARQTVAPTVAELGALVLGPVAGRLSAAERLWVVADGALHWVPFAALPLPGGEDGRLLDRLEVVHLASISLLAAASSPGAAEPGGRPSVAVLADPIFDPCDPRARRDDEACRQTETAAGESVPFERLPGSRREAEAIVELARGEDVLLALDFQADRDLVTSGRLAPYRLVHFATHAVVDDADARLSGLVLSGSDRQGRRRDGVLRLDDVYNLELSADLVVLSGCRTALGREIRGEGLVGLVRGFLHAGAGQVVASLWRVDDGTTVELMRHFYRGLLDGGLAPAAALRAAQLAVAAEPRTRDPYHWAGFVVQSREIAKVSETRAASRAAK